MLLTLVQADRIHKFSLPEKRSGQYWLTRLDADGSTADLVSIEALEDQWVMKSNRRATVLDDEGLPIRSVVLEPNRFYSIEVRATQEAFILETEPSTVDRKRLTRRTVTAGHTLTVGRADGATIRFASRFASTRHAEIRVDSSGMTIIDGGSANGTFVNGVRVSEQKLAPGDVVSIVGLLIIAGGQFIALNNPDGLVEVDDSQLPLLRSQEIEPPDEFEDDEIEEASARVDFSRPPRFMTDVSTAKIRIDPPPSPPQDGGLPLIMIIGPALTMGMASATMAVFAVTSVRARGGSWVDALPSVIMSVSMLLGMVLWPVLSRRYERRQAAEAEARRQERYREYLDEKRDEIERARAVQSQLLITNVVPIESCVLRAEQRATTLWERAIDRSRDFVRLRLGIGSWPFDAEIQASEAKFTVNKDDLEQEMLALVDEPKDLSEVPVSMSLAERPVVGVIGERAASREFVKGLVLQLAALHSYDELRLVFIYDERESGDWEFARWLPHVWSEDESFRYVATSAKEVKEISARIEPEIQARCEINNIEDAEQISPFYVVLALSRELASKAEFVNKILRLRQSLGFAVVAAYDEQPRLPKECRAVISLSESVAKLSDPMDLSGAFLAFAPDISVGNVLRDVSTTLANTRLDSASEAFTLPTLVTFLELFGVGKVEHLNVLNRWKESNPVLSLEAAVGIDTSGGLLTLDIHEKYHGPHGLIAGMTGSGKSEFIMTYLLALAINYHPDEVAFVLIDYKGGGMANALSGLPHVAGTITNLDGAEVNRSLVSLQSELKRRQALFNQASERSGVSNIDIYKYQSLYRAGEVDQPLPHLVVISDEFAELKSQEPEFMAQLVSAARIGRSLGVHLILATQKPSGVVDDQIWSNSRFRVSLKVQERADSMEVIKRPDAAELSTTGRFYLQVGFNELFEMGQSAWAAAPYYPADRVEKPYDDTVSIVSNTGGAVHSFRPPPRRAQAVSAGKQLDEIVKYVVRLATEEKVSTRPLWLPPIPELITIEQLRRKYPASPRRVGDLAAFVGEYDDPARQQQGRVSLSFSADGNLLVYGSAGAGKTEFLSTMLYALIEDYTPEEVNIYALDFGAESLQAFSSAPHVGDIVIGAEAEKVASLFKMLTRTVAERKKLMAGYGNEFSAFLRESGERVPFIVTAINNLSSLIDAYPEAGDQLVRLARDGVRYGVYFVLTAAGVGDVRYQLSQSFKQVIALQLNDPADYPVVIGKTGGVRPSPTKGRGLVRIGDVFEFQTAQIVSSEEGMLAAIRSCCQKAQKEWDGTVAPPVPVLPALVTPAEVMARHGRSQGTPVGIEVEALKVATFDVLGSFATLVLSQDGENAAFLQGLAEVLAARGDSHVVVFDPRGEFKQEGEATYRVVSGRDMDSAVVEIFELMAERNKTRKAAEASGDPVPAFNRYTCILSSYGDVMSQLSDDPKDKLSAVLENCTTLMGLSFVVADGSSSASTIVYETWGKRHLSAANGIWLGDGVSDQYTLKPANLKSDAYRSIGSGFGYVIRKGKATLMKCVTSSALAQEADQNE